MLQRRSPRAQGFATPSTIRAFFISPLVRELDKHGIEVDGFLRRFGLSAAQLTSLYERVPLAQFVAMAEDAAKRLDRPYLGLDLGKTFTLFDLGPFYLMFILAKDLEGALRTLTRYQSAWQTNSLLDLERGKDTSLIRYQIQDPAIWPRRQDAELALATFTTLIRQLGNRRWRPSAVEFEHDLGDRGPTLAEFFKAPVLGNRQTNALIIPTSDLDQPLRSHIDPSDDRSIPNLERHMLQLLGPSIESTNTHSARVGTLIARRMGRAPVMIDVIASEMSMSVRSLRRHLTQEGTSFRQIIQSHRRTLIEKVLSDEGAGLSELASRLNYSDGAVLSRAFKSWTGISPRAYSKRDK